MKREKVLIAATITDQYLIKTFHLISETFPGIIHNQELFDMMYEEVCDACDVVQDTAYWDEDTFQRVITYIMVSKIEMNSKAKWLDKKLNKIKG